jgi:hypothetical protein
MCDVLQDSGSHREDIARAPPSSAAERLHALSTSVVQSGAKPDMVEESNAGKLTFHDDGGAEILMPLVQRGSCRSTELEDITYCIHQLGKLDTTFVFSLTTSTAGQKCQFWIAKHQLQKLPLLLDFMSMNGKDASPGAGRQGEASKGQPTKRKRRSTGMLTQAKVEPVVFDPPASSAGLACLLLLLEEAASPLQLFGASLCGPRLAVHCLLVSPTSSASCVSSAHDICHLVPVIWHD